MERIKVTAMFQDDGCISPTAFSWQTQEITVASVGRQWQEEDGIHILVMAPDEQIYQLLFHQPDATWFLIPRFTFSTGVRS